MPAVAFAVDITPFPQSIASSCSVKSLKMGGFEDEIEINREISNRFEVEMKE